MLLTLVMVKATQVNTRCGSRGSMGRVGHPMGSPESTTCTCIILTATYPRANRAKIMARLGLGPQPSLATKLLSLILEVSLLHAQAFPSSLVPSMGW